MAQQTPLHGEHLALGAKLVDFAGWRMPIAYTSQIAEHKTVRASAGMFDVSHMAVVDISGAGARDFLRRLLANDIAKVDDGRRALYSCMLNTRGGVIDDLIVYHLGENFYRAVLNAATTQTDLAWMTSQARDYDVRVDQREHLAVVAVQGPRARELAARALDPGVAERALRLEPFEALHDGELTVARTGYTGEHGFEIMLDGADAPALWRHLQDIDVAPAGLGARDTLRLEAGLCLYGQDLDEHHTPCQSGLGWTVAFEPRQRHFIGRAALADAREREPGSDLVGLVLEGRGVMRAGAAVRPAAGNAQPTAGGVVTSGSYAPTLARSIALARVPADWTGAAEVDIRGTWRPATIVSLPFVRHGKPRIENV